MLYFNVCSFWVLIFFCDVEFLFLFCFKFILNLMVGGEGRCESLVIGEIVFLLMLWDGWFDI